MSSILISDGIIYSFFGFSFFNKGNKCIVPYTADNQVNIKHAILDGKNSIELEHIIDRGKFNGRITTHCIDLTTLDINTSTEFKFMLTPSIMVHNLKHYGVLALESSEYNGFDPCLSLPQMENIELMSVAEIMDKSTDTISILHSCGRSGFVFKDDVTGIFNHRMLIQNSNFVPVDGHGLGDHRCNPILLEIFSEVGDKMSLYYKDDEGGNNRCLKLTTILKKYQYHYSIEKPYEYDDSEFVKINVNDY